MNNKTPVISVLMPVYNGEKYLNEAIDSILNQTYTDFEFIILNDGSTDRTEEIILSYDDPRIVYVKNKENLQIVKTLNKGIALAKGKYIARMDADDISLPERFKKQVGFMEEHPHIDICGSAIRFLDESYTVWYPPQSHEAIKIELLFGSALAHPTIMATTEFFKKNPYNIFYNKAEDYALWMETIDNYQFYNFQEVLLFYRVHENQSSTLTETAQWEVSCRVKEAYISKLSFCLDAQNLKILYDFLCEKDIQLDLLGSAIVELIACNAKNKIFFRTILEERISQAYYYRLMKQGNIKQICLFLFSPLNKYARITIIRLCKNYLYKLIKRYL